MISREELVCLWFDYNDYSFANMTSKLNLTSLYNGSGSAQNALNQCFMRHAEIMSYF